MAISDGSNQETVLSETMFSEAGLPETEIVKQAQAGDADAFGELYQRHLGAISRYVRCRVTEADEAENLTQVVFVKAWQGLPRYQPTKTPFLAWLYRIASNTVIDYYRTHKETADIDGQWHLADEQASPEEALLSVERSESVRNAITQLKPSYQQVISLRFLDERDYPETADMLDRKINAVRVLQHRALGALQKVLTQEQISWIVTITAVLTLALGGSVVLAAEGSLPGDPLYPLKRGAESSLLSVTGDSLDVRLHRALANRRIEEMENLLVVGRFDDLSTPGRAYAEHLTDLVISLSLLAEQDPVEAQRLTKSATQALTIHDELLTRLTSSDAAMNNAVLNQISDAARQTRSTLDEMAPESQPTPIPESGESAPESSTIEPEIPEPAPTQSSHGLITDTDQPRESDISMPVPPSSNRQRPITERLVVQSGPRPRATVDPLNQHPADPSAPAAVNDNDTAGNADVIPPDTLVSTGPQAEQRRPTRSVQPDWKNGAHTEQILVVGPIAWPFPTLHPKIHHPVAPLGAPQVLPHRGQPTNLQGMPEFDAPGQTRELLPQNTGQGGSQSGKGAKTEVESPEIEPPVPAADKPAPGSNHADNSDQSQSPPDADREETNGGGSASDNTIDGAGGQPEGHGETSSDSSENPGGGQHGSSSDVGQRSEPPQSGERSSDEKPDTDNSNGSSNSAQQGDSSSSSKDQGRR